ncbi:MAG: transaldolase family protein [bacterium]
MAAPLNIFERLAKTSPQTEVWWDSSPLIYKGWTEKIMPNFPAERHEILREQFRRMYDPDAPEKTIFGGVTTNPPLSLQAIQFDEAYWAKVVDEIIAANRGIDVEQLFWKTYMEVIRRGAAMMRKRWEASGGKFGYLSGQVDPRDCYNYDKMLEQAMEIASQAPNIMVKCPGTAEGYRLLEELTSRAIGTNNTLSFIMPQFKAAAEAARRGLKRAKKNGIDTSKWRAVITHMSTRYTLLGNFQKEADQKGMNLTETDYRWAEIALLKKAIRMLNEEGYPSKMLLCSIRVSPTVNGEKRVWHLEKLAGAPLVFTCPPPFIEATIKEVDHIELDPEACKEDVPEDVIDKLMGLEYFRRAYDADGYTHEEFNTHPAVLATADEFSRATQKMVDFCASRLK